MLDDFSSVLSAISSSRCIDRRFVRTLRRGVLRSRNDFVGGNLSRAVSRLENAFLSANANPGKFVNCPAAANVRGYVQAKALIVAGRIFERFIAPGETYPVPMPLPEQ